MINPMHYGSVPSWHGLYPFSYPRCRNLVLSISKWFGNTIIKKKIVIHNKIKTEYDAKYVDKSIKDAE